MSAINIFLERPANQLVANLVLQGKATKKDVFLLPHNSPYYMYAVKQGILPADINAAVSGEPPETIDAKMYELDISGKSVDVVHELEFLEVLGLAYSPDEAPTTWYVSPESAPLYKMFQSPLPAIPTAADRVRVMKPIVDFFKDVLLPGRMWRIWTVRVGLADNIQTATALDQEIRVVQEALAQLAGIFP